MGQKLAIRAVTSLRQKDLASFEVRVRLSDGSPAVLILSTAALAELARRIEPIFRHDESASQSSD
jgi:hypothetical protein